MCSHFPIKLLFLLTRNWKFSQHKVETKHERELSARVCAVCALSILYIFFDFLGVNLLLYIYHNSVVGTTNQKQNEQNFIISFQSDRFSFKSFTHTFAKANFMLQLWWKSIVFGFCFYAYARWTGSKATLPQFWLYFQYVHHVSTSTSPNRHKHTISTVLSRHHQRQPKQNIIINTPISCGGQK